MFACKLQQSCVCVCYHPAIQASHLAMLSYLVRYVEVYTVILLPVIKN